ncbi:hypothetical protein M5D96_012236 [Drosophila gunungcola]|uniref:Uncharacterized protein n=1 Tax=Drosophila gunungcola TaxID=103775 RepID=A0A9P9YDP0_9MUSC|nr:hypothetical protein M5D96_012236 [Drosophila gunungcola]
MPPPPTTTRTTFTTTTIATIATTITTITTKNQEPRTTTTNYQPRPVPHHNEQNQKPKIKKYQIKKERKAEPRFQVHLSKMSSVEKCELHQKCITRCSFP